MKDRDLNALGFTMVGEAAVDSGQIMIVDPCYVLPDCANEYGDGQLATGWIGNKREVSYEGLLDYYNAVDPEMEKPHVQPWGDAFGFISHTLYGDGVYPIYARIVNGRYAAVMIDFEPENEEDDV